MFKSITVFTTIIVFIYLTLGVLTGIILEKQMTKIEFPEKIVKVSVRVTGQAVRWQISAQP